MMGSGGMIVMDEDDCMVAVAQFYLDFTVEESCGKCVPCREGNKALYHILNKITHGEGTMADLDRLKQLSTVIKSTSLCALGQTAPNPVLSTLNNFYDDYVQHVVEKKCRAKRCRALIQYLVVEENCIGCGACKRACPADAISGEPKKVHFIDQEKCIKCGACFQKCKFNAIAIE
jgi:Na+-translocating ferredoxin:NAD+ oxidoreductase RNF subunit RnfB